MITDLADIIAIVESETDDATVSGERKVEYGLALSLLQLASLGIGPEDLKWEHLFYTLLDRYSENTVISYKVELVRSLKERMFQDCLHSIKNMEQPVRDAAKKITQEFTEREGGAADWWNWVIGKSKQLHKIQEIHILTGGVFYKFEALTNEGKEIAGNIAAPDKEEAETALRAAGLTNIELKILSSPRYTEEG